MPYWLSVILSACARADRETAARITEEIGNLMKEIETLVEEKNKDSSDLTQMVSDGENYLCNPETLQYFHTCSVNLAIGAMYYALTFLQYLC